MLELKIPIIAAIIVITVISIDLYFSLEKLGF